MGEGSMDVFQDDGSRSLSCETAVTAALHRRDRFRLIFIKSLQLSVDETEAEVTAPTPRLRSST